METKERGEHLICPQQYVKNLSSYVIGDKLLSVIIAEIQEAKYFSLSVDSTPDLCHVDQLTITVWYVSMETNEVVELLLCFLPIERHTGEFLATNVVKFLQEHNIDISNARGQSYDNASNMSGKYNGS